ncbi:hypothetical protein ACSAZK_00030 [Methanosarcina sp. Mfa9]
MAALSEMTSVGLEVMASGVICMMNIRWLYCQDLTITITMYL